MGRAVAHTEGSWDMLMQGAAGRAGGALWGVLGQHWCCSAPRVAQQQLPLLLPLELPPGSLPDFIFLRLCVTARQRSISALWHHRGGMFSSLEFWAQRGTLYQGLLWLQISSGSCVSLSVMSYIKVVNIRLPLESCCLVFQFICPIFKSWHLPNILKLVAVKDII